MRVLLLLAAAAAYGADFDYYLLALSYAPDFCAQPVGNKDPRECGAGRKVAFVVHGMWPQWERGLGTGPDRCGGSPVARDIVRAMLRYMPTESLIQHEWMKHGTCSGLTARDYFSAIAKARDAVNVPPQLVAPSQTMRFTPSEVETMFAAANPGFPRDAFRVSCYRDGELEEARICFTKDLKPRPCPAMLRRCRAETVTILPVR